MNDVHVDVDLDALPLLDAEVIAELREIMEDEFIGLIEMFLNDLPIQMERLQIAVAQSDAETVYRVAHRIKSSCGNLGALRLMELIRRMEQAGRRQVLNDAADLLRCVQTDAEATCAGLRALSG